MAEPRPWVVTGGAGFLGSHLVDELRRRRRPVIVIDDLSVGKPELLAAHAGDPAFQLMVMDIRDRAALEARLRDAAPEAVIHLAALHFIPAAVADPPRAVSLNVLGTQSVLSACRAAAVPRIWFASTGDVYAPSEQAHAEDGAIAPFNIYGLTKWMGEELVRLEARERPDARFLIGRLFNLYGPRETNPHLLPEVLAQLRAAPQAPLRLGSLWPRRDFVPVADAARAVADSLEQAPPGVTTLNVGTGRARSMREVLDLIGELRGAALTVELDAARVRPVERPHLQADPRRLHELIGWVPHDDLRAGLGALLAEEGS